MKYLLLSKPLTFIKPNHNSRKIPCRAVRGAQVNNTWRYAMYMQTKQVIWVLNFDSYFQ